MKWWVTGNKSYPLICSIKISFSLFQFLTSWQISEYCSFPNIFEYLLRGTHIVFLEASSRKSVIVEFRKLTSALLSITFHGGFHECWPALATLRAHIWYSYITMGFPVHFVLSFNFKPNRSLLISGFPIIGNMSFTAHKNEGVASIAKNLREQLR